MSRPISFLSDFGRSDEFVGVVHGVIARIAPDVRVIDIVHDLPPGDVRGGALALLRAVQYLPEGVLLAVVDPGVGTSRRAIAARTPWGDFVGPDNGLLGPAVAMVGGASEIVSIESEAFRLPSQGATFDGRDVFGPAAAVLASGEADITDLGPVIAPNDVTPLLLPLVEVAGSVVTAQVWWVDHFGNAQTNASPEDLSAAGVMEGDTVVMRIGGTSYHLEWVRSYGDVEPGEGLIHTDSSGQIAVAVRGGRAVESFPLDDGVAIEFLASTRRPGPAITGTA